MGGNRTFKAALYAQFARVGKTLSSPHRIEILDLSIKPEPDMIFRPFHYFDTGCAAYLFGCGSAGQCAVVDPQERDVDTYLAFAEAKAMKVTHVFDTHIHADHRSGGRELARRVGAKY